ncbi:hypothetical protein CAP36_04975 [Chitinophagaceae bacterium IBVUCB2]|nr:hypothetical protein CAP36_04975 [Chitinophagaceae bacterium IBVUCB2]
MVLEKLVNSGNFSKKMLMRCLKFIGLFYGCLCISKIFAQQPELILPSANSNQMKAVAISPNEKLYASGDLDGKIKIWEAATGKLLASLNRGHPTALAFTKDNKALIITGFTPAEAYIIQTGKSISLAGYDFSGGLATSPDGKWIAISGQYYSEKGSAGIRILDASTFHLVDSIPEKFYNEEIKFSNDSKSLALYGGKETELWDIEKRKVTASFEGHSSRITNLEFSENDSQILTTADDSTARLWETQTGKPIIVFKGHTGTVWEAKFHPDGQKIITVSSDNTAKIWNKLTGEIVQTMTNANGWIYRVQIAPDKKTFALGDYSGFCSVWNAVTNKKIYYFRAGKESLYFLNYLKKTNSIVTGNYDPVLSRWNIATGKKEMTYGSHNERFIALQLSNDEKFLLTSSRDGVVRKIEVSTGKILFYKKLFNNEWATSVDFSKNDSLFVVAGGKAGSVVFNSVGGDETILNDVSRSYESFSKFSPNGKYVLHDDNSTVQLIRLSDNKLLLTIDSISSFTEQCFSPDGAYIITGGSNKVKIWSVATQELVQSVTVATAYPHTIEMSFDSKYFLCFDNSGSLLQVWETATGKLVTTLNDINYAGFLPNKNELKLVYSNGKIVTTPVADVKETILAKLKEPGKGIAFHFVSNEILVIHSGGNISIHNLLSGATVLKLRGNEVTYGKSGKYLYVLTDDALEVYTLPQVKLAYKHFVTGTTDFLVQDNFGRFDGTEAARKMLYFVCGEEVIELDQAKNQLWVPNLVERITTGDSINAKTLNQLNICGLTPEIEDASSKTDEYHFKIIPRRGGLGETILSINGNPTKTYKPAQLKKNGQLYELVIKKSEFGPYFIAGAENQVTLKAFTADNTISSRGFKVNEDKTRQAATPPNLYAVMVGVSDYKGDELDLKYAAKDASDISTAVSNAAKKLLNTDGKEHVFMYNLTTAKERYQLPEKNSIKKTLEEIGKKATANDILLIFFAGHGVMEGVQKQFYFLTADASSLTAGSAIADVGISTAELTEWMKPQNIKAQKRILIFDACNSGQAINDFVKMGADEQNYMAARNDNEAQQVKAIDKLNEKSGLFILSASASNQSAYEMGRYSQGLLTYSLLKAIKQQPDILEDGKYLNVSRWFNAAEKTVTELSKENGARQEPQVVTNTNFNIGLVDEDVIAKIILPQEKPLFAASNFQNSDEAIADDDLELSRMVNLQLNELATRGTDSKIVYVTATNSPDAYSLSGRYTLKGNSITITVNVKQNKTIKTKFEINGTKDKLNQLTKSVVDKATELVK